MKEYTHILFGVGLALALLKPHSGAAYTVIAFSYLGSVMPDVDVLYKHRMLMHNVFMMVLTTTLVASAFGAPVLVPYFVGYASHLFLDSLTTYGIALFYPFKDKMFGIRITKSNSVIANALFSAAGSILILRWYFCAKGP